MIHSPFADDFVRVPPPAENPKHDPGDSQEDEAENRDEDDDDVPKVSPAEFKSRSLSRSDLIV